MAEKTKWNDALIGTLTKRQKLEMLRTQLKNTRSSFIPEWRDLAHYIQPRRTRFFTSDTNRGERRNHHIVNSTASLAIRTMKSGMMGGITSPARPWVKLDAPDPTMAQSDAAKDWLYKTTQRMLTIFLQSNLYNSLPTLYGDMGGFGTGAMLVEEDDDEVLRTYVYPVGSYCIAVDDKNRVNTFQREFELTVSQIVDKFGKKDHHGNLDWEHFNWENFSDRVRIAVQNNQWQNKIEVVHTILPNDQFDPRQIGPKGKKYASYYYETGATQGAQVAYGGPEDNVFLRESGYDLFPVLCPRWEVTGEDAYGTEYPAIICIGDVKSLQVMEKRMAQAIEKKVNPPMTGPSSLRNQKTSLLPGDITYQDVREGQLGFRPVHEVQFQVTELDNKISKTEQRIDKAFFADLFLMMSNDEQAQPITATEVNERHEEKLLALGPVLEQLNQDVLDPLIDLAYSFMVKQGKVDPVPPELHGVPLKIEYTSIMAQAQKLLGISADERFLQTTGSVMALAPSAGDGIDFDEFIRDYGNKVSIAPKILRDPQVMAQIRASRAQAQQQQQQSAMANQNAQTAKHLAQAPTDTSNALTQMMDQGNAGNMVPTQ
jgi:hypothetical protein